MVIGENLFMSSDCVVTMYRHIGVEANLCRGRGLTSPSPRTFSFKKTYMLNLSKVGKRKCDITSDIQCCHRNIVNNQDLI